MKTIIQLPKNQDVHPFQELQKRIYFLEKKLEELLLSQKVLVIKTVKEIHFLRHEDISYIQADSNYAMVFLCCGKKILVSKTLKNIQAQLSSRLFVRIHQSYIVNIRQIENCYNGINRQLVLKKGKELPVSRRYFERLLEMYSQ